MTASLLVRQFVNIRDGPDLPTCRRHALCAHGAGISTEILSMHALVPDPSLQVLVVPGNPALQDPRLIACVPQVGSSTGLVPATDVIPCRLMTPINSQELTDTEHTILVVWCTGNAGYYIPFMADLHAMFKGHAYVVSVSHAGHDTGPENRGEKLYDLDDQIRHKADVIRTQLLQPGRPPLVILAHSIGAYMTIHAVAQLEGLQGSGGTATATATPSSSTASHAASTSGSILQQDSNSMSGSEATAGSSQQQVPRTREQPQSTIYKVVALMPFFQAEFATSWRQRWLRTAAARFELMGGVARGLSSTPAWLQERFIRFWASDGLDPHALETTRGLLHPPSVRNNFHLAHHEFMDLDKPFDWGLLRALGSRLHVVACPQDVWMSRGQYDHMVAQVPGLQTVWAEDLTHAFCVSGPQCARVASLVAGMVLGQASLFQWIAAECKAAASAREQREREEEGRAVEAAAIEVDVRVREDALAAARERVSRSEEDDGDSKGSTQLWQQRTKAAEADVGSNRPGPGRGSGTGNVLGSEVNIGRVVHDLRVLVASKR